MKDGTEFDCRPGDLMDIPAGHDAWVLGDEPFESLAWMGGTTWLAPLQTLKDRVLVTLLFTDIVDSTGLAARLGDRKWVDLLDGHNQRLADTVDRFRGQIAKLTGDGVLAVFDGAARAIRCALACQRDANDLDLTIRAAVHTGEVELAGDEIHGLALHEASRIMSLAGPGEVLVSEVTKAFARDSQLEFEDRGEVELRGLSEPMRLHSVRPG
jgi:class 3 adenylate cyclase